MDLAGCNVCKKFHIVHATGQKNISRNVRKLGAHLTCTFALYVSKYDNFCLEKHGNCTTMLVATNPEATFLHTAQRQQASAPPPANFSCGLVLSSNMVKFM